MVFYNDLSHFVLVICSTARKCLYRFNQLLSYKTHSHHTLMKTLSFPWDHHNLNSDLHFKNRIIGVYFSTEYLNQYLVSLVPCYF